jgi:hypothetical protein
MRMKVRPLYLWIAALALLLALAAVFYRGIFTRLYADDFCMAGDAIHLGLPAMFAKWYSTWTGRFAFILGTGLFGLGGPKFAVLGPFLIGGLWLFGLEWAFLPLLQRSGWPRPRLLALLAASLSLLALLSSIPNFFQSFFWQNSLVNYTLPLVFLTFSIGFLLRAWLGRINPLPAAVTLFILAFVSGGFTESFSAMQVTLFALIILVLLLVRDRATRTRLLPVLGAALLGGLVAMVIVILAPGNAVRLSSVGGQAGHPSLLRLVTFSLRNMTHIIGKYFLQTPVWALASVLLPFLTGWLFTIPVARQADRWTISSLWSQSWAKFVVLGGISTLVLVTAACAPVVFALNAYPDDRTILIPQFVIVLGVVGISAALGSGLRQIGWLTDPTRKAYLSPLLTGVIAMVTLIAAGISIRQSVQMTPELRSAATAWDQRDAAIRRDLASGQTALTVDGGNSFFGLPNLSDDPTNWVNQCVADYYGIQQITGR